MFMEGQYYCFFTFIQWLDQIVQEKSLGDGFDLYLFPEIQKIWLLDYFQKKSKWASLQCRKFWMERDFNLFSLLLDQKFAIVHRIHCILYKFSQSHLCKSAHGCPLCRAVFGSSLRRRSLRGRGSHPTASPLTFN